MRERSSGNVTGTLDHGIAECARLEARSERLRQAGRDLGAGSEWTEDLLAIERILADLRRELTAALESLRGSGRA